MRFYVNVLILAKPCGEWKSQAAEEGTAKEMNIILVILFFISKRNKSMNMSYD